VDRALKKSLKTVASLVPPLNKETITPSRGQGVKNPMLHNKALRSQGSLSFLAIVLEIFCI